MELAKRLAVLAAFVPPGSTAADIGTDHAYLPVFLVKENICPRVVATDINPGPFRSAARTIVEHNLGDKIDLRLGDGLKTLTPGEVDVLVLAGMGGNSIREILAASPEVLKEVKFLVLQPMADPGDLRAWLSANSWKLIDEKLVEDDGKLYVIVVAVPGQEETEDPLLLEIGPRLLEKKEKLLKSYVNSIIKKYERVLTGLASANSEAAREKAIEITVKLARLREIAGCL